MFDKLIGFSLENKLLVLIATSALVVVGLISATRIPLDAVPDITNNQVQIVSTAPTLAPQEVEQLITFPLEAAMTNIPDVIEVRSISRYGLSVITIVFDESVEVMLARQYVQEQLNIAQGSLNGISEPELMPITTGLGEIYQYVLTVEPEYAHEYDAVELRSIQDWIVKRQLNGTKGIIEVSSFGGNLKQYEVALDPLLLKANGITIPEVIRSISANNQNSGGSYIEKGPYSFYIRTEGRVENIEEIEDILIKNREDIPIRVTDLGIVRNGSAKRYGAMTMDGKGEVVGGITLMLKGANSSEVLENVKERMEVVRSALPKGVDIYPYLDRSKLIARTISTVEENLILGGLIVIFVLMLLLGNLRAGLIVASVIPLSLLFALSMMRYFGISANLMSLGAIDFGIVVDGAVIIVEGLLHSLRHRFSSKRLSQGQMDDVVRTSTSQIYRSAAFGVLIILVVFIPILTLDGTEGKTFRPMAQTVGFAILGSMILSVTYVPVISSLFLKKEISAKKSFADRIMARLKNIYLPSLDVSLSRPLTTIVSASVIFLFSLILFSRLGAEFVPTLEEGDIAMQQSIKPGSSLQESIHTSTMAEKILLDNFPEVNHVVSKIGTAEVPTDPMAIEDADIMIIMKDKDEWTSANNREDLMAKMKKALYPITWAGFEFTQPIQLRFNELMTGAKSDIAVKIFGEDVALLKSKADEAAEHIRKITGAADVKVDQTDGLQQLSVKYDRVRLAQHAVTVDEVNQIIRTAYAGEVVGEVFEQERRYDLVVRLAPDFRQELDLHSLTVTDLHGQQIPLAELSEIREVEGPMLISREQARRFINVGVNVRNRDVAGLVSEIQTVLESELELPPGYEVQYGGAFENLQHATSRLLVAVPIALALIILLLFLAFNSIKETLIIFMAVPLSAVGGIFALWIRDMPFSISSGIGFIALFGVSVLNGIVLISAIKGLKKEDFPDIQALVSYACISRLRPVIMTATVAALGFLPMAISTGSGAEVQRPLATVVIGGLISSTFLTLLVLPTLYIRFNMKNWNIPAALSIVIIMVYPLMGHTQILSTYNDIEAYALTNHPILKNQSLSIQELELNNKVKVNWGPVDILYQNGQINYGGVDNQIEILQDISPLFRFHERSLVKELTESEIKKLEIDQAIERQQWKAELGRAYSNWQFYFHLWKLNETLIDDIEKSINSLDKQAELGSKDPIELGLMRNSVQAKKQKALLIAQKYRESQNKLRSIAFLPENVVLEPISYEPQTTEKIIRIDSANVFLLELEQRKSVLELSRRLANTQDRQLRVSAGYFGQSLEKDGLFQGFLIGMQIPFDNRENAHRIQKSKLAIEKLDNLKEYTYERLEQQILDLDSELSVLNNSMKVYQENILPLQNELLAKANEQYENGAIDLLEYYQIKEELVDREVEYLELTKKYNDKIIAIEQLNLVKQ